MMDASLSSFVLSRSHDLIVNCNKNWHDTESNHQLVTVSFIVTMRTYFPDTVFSLQLNSDTIVSSKFNIRSVIQNWDVISIQQLYHCKLSFSSHSTWVPQCRSFGPIHIISEMNPSLQSFRFRFLEIYFNSMRTSLIFDSIENLTLEKLYLYLIHLLCNFQHRESDTQSSHVAFMKILLYLLFTPNHSNNKVSHPFTARSFDI